MAWNEPGGSGGRDPWGNRNDEQGPPDLDEVVRNLQRRLGGIFGGRGAGAGGPGGGAGAGLAGMGLIAIVGLLIWAASGIYIIDEGKRGVVLQLGAYDGTTGPGPHWFAPFLQTVEVVEFESVRSVELGYRADEALMLTQDENIIDIKFAVQYQVKDPRDYLFNVRDPDETMRQALESAVREVVGKSQMDFVITGGRSEVVARAQKVLQDILDSYGSGLVVTSLNMQDAQAPQQVQGAFADAVKAREDEQRLKNEAEAYSNDVIPKARGQAARVLEEAQAYKEKVIAEAEGEAARFQSVLAKYRQAPEVMRQRLYLDSMESVLSSSSKVLVDSDGGNNLLYLPLDRLMQRPEPSATEASAAAASGAAAVTNNEQPPRAEPEGDAAARPRENLRRREVR